MNHTDIILNEILFNYPIENGSLIPLLQKVQQKIGYISIESVEVIAEYLRMTESQVFGAASFYSQFRFTEPGRHSVCVCLGTACHVGGGETLLESIERDIKIKPGESTEDKRYDLNRVACLGCCALAPVVKVDEDIHSHVNVTKLQEILERYE